MSQADLHHDSAGNQPSGSLSPSTGDGQVPAAVPPPPPSEGDPAGSSLPPVPPPPPVRSSLPPVRPAPEPGRPIQGRPIPGRPIPGNAGMGNAARGTANGVGSAKGLRWRGETANVKTKAANSPAVPTDEHGQEEEEWASDRVTREAPPWLVSMVVHLVLLLILALISTPVGAGLGSVMLSIGQSDREAPAELAEFSISTDDSINDSDLMEESEVEVDMASIFDSAELNDAEEISPMEFGAGPNLAAVRPMFDGRSGAMKKALLAIYGGTAETQDAVARGLAWLKRNQQKNGSWSMRGPYDDGAISENECAATAMALLAFLGDGNTHIKGEYSDEVEKGVKHLLKLQERSGFMAKAARGHEKMYAQAQATIALCELYGMTKDSWLRGPAQLAIDFAEGAQSPQGGWRYEPNVDSDTSITGWYVMALESGRSAGLEVNVSVLTKVDEYLDSAQSYDGAAYGYQINTGASPAMTAEGLLCRQYISWKREHPPLRRGIDALLLDAPFTLADRDVYYWYYATQVLHHFGGPAWRKWNDSNVNRVGFTRLERTGTLTEYGFFMEYTEDSLMFDTDSELYGHLSREMLRGANEITEDLLQADLLNAADVKVFTGAATSVATMTGANGAEPSLITLQDLKKLSITLDDNRTPKKTTIIKGSRLTDTKVISAARVAYIGSELQIYITELTDSNNNPAFVPVEKYADAATLMNGEIGAIPAANLRIVVVPQMMHWAGVGAAEGTNDGYQVTTGNYDVAPLLVVGENAFATVGLQGHSGAKPKFRIIVKKPGEKTADRNDPYGKLGFSSIKFFYGFIKLRGERIAVAYSVIPE